MSCNGIKHDIIHYTKKSIHSMIFLGVEQMIIEIEMQMVNNSIGFTSLSKQSPSANESTN